MFLQNILQTDIFMGLIFHSASDQNVEETGDNFFFQQWQNDQPVVKVISQVQEQKRHLLLQQKIANNGRRLYFLLL